ncbi:hypothetical protein BHM03_00012169 [Ensete ventricosum]|nr:hypothetical protein BHM03_00012169 [Ensete ventricosum]
MAFFCSTLRFDPRIRSLLDLSIYLDISNEITGHGFHDFASLSDPQKQYADVIIEVLPTRLIPYKGATEVLRVRLVMKEGVKHFTPVYLFDEGSTISWTPCGGKLSCSYPGIRFFYGPDTYFCDEASVLEMDGKFDRLDELIYVESHLSNLSTKYYGEVTQQMLKHADFPGSNDGTGLLQTIIGLKIRQLCEQIIAGDSSHGLKRKQLRRCLRLSSS